jgi:hypothetical protein
VMTAEDGTREERTEELVAAFGRLMGRS